MNKLLHDFGDEKILKWLKGSSSTYLLEDIKSRFVNSSTQYSSLIQKDVFPVLLNEKMVLFDLILLSLLRIIIWLYNLYLIFLFPQVQVSVSHQLALSMIADQEELTLKHIVTALDIILQYEKSDCARVEDKLPILIKYFSVFESINNIMNSYQNPLGGSLRAYLCHAIIDWYLKDSLTEEEKSECVDGIVEILEKCIDNLLNKDSVKFWTIANEIKNLEMKLTEVVGE